MRKIAHIAVAMSLAGAAIGMASTATAAPSSVGSAQDTVSRLQSLGYNVALNGSKTQPLSDCFVTAVHPGDPGTVSAAQFTTIWVDIVCPPTNN